MRILHLYKDYPPVIGGIEKHLRLVAERQARRGHEVSVLVTATEGPTTVTRENGVEIVRAARLVKLASAPLSAAFFAELRHRRPKIAHLHFPYPPGELAQLVCGRSRATVMTYHSDIVRQRRLRWLYRPLMRRVLAKTDLVMPTSRAYLESSPVLRPIADKCRIVPLGIDTERFTDPEPAGITALRERYAPPLVVFVGRLRYYKSVEVLIAAMERVAATLLIVGDGDMEEVWRRQAAASQAASRIHFTGEVPESELPFYYAAADIFVLPSGQRSEAYGLCQIEAMAAGTPVVSTELGTGTSFVNVDGETGLVVPPRDPGAMAAALARLLGDENLRRQMGEKAQERAVSELDAEVMLDRIDEVYREALSGTSGDRRSRAAPTRRVYTPGMAQPLPKYEDSEPGHEVCFRTTRGPAGDLVVQELPLTLDILLHPREEDQVTQSESHRRTLHPLDDTLVRHLEKQPGVFVYSDLMILWDDPDLRNVCPDNFVVVDPLLPEDVVDSYDVRDQGKRPCMTLEVVSESTKDNKDKDEKHNLKLFEKAGVKDHVLVYPKRPGKRDRIELRCRTLSPLGKYRDIPPDAQGRFLLQSVNLWISVSEDGERLVFEDATTGERLLSSTEEEVRRREAESRLGEVEGRLEEAETRVEEETSARREAESRIEKETAARRKAEERIAALEALLARSNQEPEDVIDG